MWHRTHIKNHPAVSIESSLQDHSPSRLWITNIEMGTEYGIDTETSTLKITWKREKKWCNHICRCRVRIVYQHTLDTKHSLMVKYTLAKKDATFKHYGRDFHQRLITNLIWECNSEISYTTLSNHYSGITLPPKAYCKVNCLYWSRSSNFFNN
jgi:hypothetical protein